MPQEVTVDFPGVSQKSYRIHVGKNLLEKISEMFSFEAYSKVVVVTDETVQPLLLDKLLAVLPAGAASVVLPSGEQQKHIESVQRIWTALHAAGCDRKSVVINFGGGVIGDVGGFAASTYMRGIDFLNVPTTLLSQVDASVGGKTGFNFDGVKNLIGTFNQPAGIIIDTQVLGSLSERELVSGFGEIIKHGLISSEEHFKKVTAKKPSEFSEEELIDIIAESCRLKAMIVQGDATETGTRKILNFGHTIGHAVEAISLETNSPLLHGEAVSIGMVAEATISNLQGMLPAAETQAIKTALLTSGLPITTHGTDRNSIMKKMQSDKKNEKGEINFTLLEAIGRPCYDQLVPEAVITEAVQVILG